MTHVMFECAITGTAVITGTPEEVLSAVPDTTRMLNPFTCSACGLLHARYKAEARLETASA
jgi:hypothetical protein